MENAGRNIALATIAVLLIGIAAWRFTSAAAGTSLIPDEFTTTAVCLECKQESEITYGSDEKTPYACPACSAAAAYEWMYCRECDRKFVPKLVYRRPGDPPRPQPFFSCPACGCTSYSMYDPDDPDQSPIGTAELPKWPVPEG